jgi:hypothetical protein
MRLIDDKHKGLSISEFVEFWSKEYKEQNGESYYDDIYVHFLEHNRDILDRQKLSWMGAWKWDMIKKKDPNNCICDDVFEIYEPKPGWKQGGKKEYAIYNEVDIALLQRYRSGLEQESKDVQKDLYEEISMMNGVGIVNAVFIFHILCPSKYPLYDKFVHYAYDYIHGGVSIEYIRDVIGDQKYRHIYEYVDGYRSFFFNFMTRIKGMNKEDVELNERNVDKALWAFGRWLKKHPKGCDDGQIT